MRWLKSPSARRFARPRRRRERAGLGAAPGRARAQLRIFIDQPQGGGLDDCERASREISALLDVEDPVPTGYTLEVSSPGIDRPLTRAEDFSRFAGHEARIELASGIDGRRRFKGTLIGREGSDIVIDVSNEKDTQRMRLPLADVADAKLVLTDRLIAESLKARDVKPKPDA